MVNKNKHGRGTAEVVVAATLSTCTWEVLGSNLGRETDYHDVGISWFSQSLHANAASFQIFHNSSLVTRSTVLSYIVRRLLAS
jgi:hypothetical protein